ncbi:MAG: fatty acid desaturase [Cyanobacteria bacterium P01_E01_bin.34]
MKIIDFCKCFLQFQIVDGLSDWSGLWVAGAIAAAWLSSLIFFLSLDLAGCSAIVVVLGLLIRAFLHTGLFAIAHDAIHNTVFPQRPRLNRWVGRLALGLYGLLSYDICYQLHWRHHRSPATHLDPDYHVGSGEDSIWDAVGWYFRFVASYLNVRQLALVVVGIGLCAVSLVFGARVELQNLILFWMLPWCLSSIQLFFFGTYLPHRFGHSSNSPHAIKSYYFSELWSFLACYHFGYHWEHHTYPNVPWYRLPQTVRQASTASRRYISALESIN